jgi:AcrR family transcriptional regulator
LVRSAQNTRDRILDAARRLFDVSGTAAVSTNHIAASAGVSPGNLYYHYSNKEQIVAALVELCAERLGAAWSEATAEKGTDIERFEAAIRRGVAALAEFSFLPQELFALAAHMPSVAERERRMRSAQIAAVEVALQELVAARKVRDPGAGRLRQLAELSWLVALASLADARLAGDAALSPAERAADATLSLFAAYVVGGARAGG